MIRRRFSLCAGCFCHVRPRRSPRSRRRKKFYFPIRWQLQQSAVDDRQRRRALPQARPRRRSRLHGLLGVDHSIDAFRRGSGGRRGGSGDYLQRGERRRRRDGRQSCAAHHRADGEAVHRKTGGSERQKNRRAAAGSSRALRDSHDPRSPRHQRRHDPANGQPARSRRRHAPRRHRRRDDFAAVELRAGKRRLSPTRRPRRTTGSSAFSLFPKASPRGNPTSRKIATWCCG